MHRRFLLVHGSWHGAWCWYKVAPRLRHAGEVLGADLPGRHGASLVTLSRMVRALARQLADTPTTIVAHSRYGVLTTALAEAYPAAIRRVVYLAAFLLPSGARVKDHFAADRDPYIRPFVRLDRLRLRDRLAPEAQVEGLYADCHADDVQLARGLLCAEPSLPALARVSTGERFERVPRAYIRLSRDRAVSPALQDRLLAATPVDRVESLAASHSAYLSQPDELARTILCVDRP
jgi:pimeloyl-ACP methyl ester carboxylesterase